MITVASHHRSIALAIEEAEEKLRWRAGLPGASIYDQAAHLLRVLQTQGVPAVDLLSLAFSSSWYVNSRASSRAMQKWLFSAAGRGAWSALLTSLAFDMSLEDWVSAATGKKEVIAAHVATLATGWEGGTLVAVTKVLALLRPQLVPLMDDAALWLALGRPGEEPPATADAPKADASLFIPMMDWFASQTLANEESLIAIATNHAPAVLDAPQTLDRLLWVISWGDRLRAPADRSDGRP